MDAFCPEGFSTSLVFCQVGDAENPQKAARDATRHGIKRFWEVGDAEEASIQAINNVEGYGNSQAEEKLSCGTKISPAYACGNGFHEVCDGNGFHEVGDDNGFHGLGDVEADDWVSPRISFSKDFVMSDTGSLSQSPPGMISSERKKGEHDNYSAEFAFLKDGPAHGAPDQAKGFMLSADELFFDGKLLPLPFPSIWTAGDDFSLSSSCDMHRQEAHNRPMSRHLSFEIPKSSSSSLTSSSYFLMRSTCPCVSSPCKNSRLGKSLGNSDACVRFSSSLPSSPSPSTPSPPPPSSSPPLPSSASSVSLPPTSPAPSPPLPSILSITPTSPLPSSSVTKCSTKLKHLFKSKIFSKDSSSPQSKRDDGVTSTCTLPISSRSFWPFSRSNSAGVSKSTAPPLPCRSNSAGVSHTCDAPSLKELDVVDVARWSTSSSVGGSKEQGPIPTVRGENSHTTEFTVPSEVVSAERIQKDGPSSDCSWQLENMKLESLVIADQHAAVTVGNLNVPYPSSHGADTRVDNAESRTMSANVKSLDFQGQSKASGKKAVGTSGKGSPGKRKGVSGVKGNGGKIVLRNLERCSAEKKLGRDGWRGLNRRGSFPVGARVSPVLNVAVCRGPSTPKVGLFRFNTSLFSKKEKPAEAAINWRNGA